MEKFNFYVVVKNEEEYNNAILLIEKLSEDIKWASGDAPSEFSYSDNVIREPRFLCVRDNVMTYPVRLSQSAIETVPEYSMKKLRKMVVKSISFKIDTKGDYDSLVPALEALGIKWASGHAPSEKNYDIPHLICEEGVLYFGSGNSSLPEITAKELFEMAGLIYKDEKETSDKEDEFSFLAWYFADDTTRCAIFNTFGTTDLKEILDTYSKKEILKRVGEAKEKAFRSGVEVISGDGEKGVIVNPMDDKLGIITENGYMEIEKEGAKRTGMVVKDIYDAITDALI